MLSSVLFLCELQVPRNVFSIIEILYTAPPSQFIKQLLGLHNSPFGADSEGVHMLRLRYNWWEIFGIFESLLLNVWVLSSLRKWRHCCVVSVDSMEGRQVSNSTQIFKSLVARHHLNVSWEAWKGSIDFFFPPSAEQYSSLIFQMLNSSFGRTL